jgi:GntR family transcriptional regulator / MocR family aminotransferase
MLPWKSIIQIQKNTATPVYLQIAGSMALEMRKGRIGPGIKLPGSRQMADILAINRRTIVSAYEELEAQGWIEIRPSKGAFSSQKLPEVKPRILAEPVSFPATTGYPVKINTLIKTPGNPMRHMTGFHEGPDARLMPTLELAKAYRSVLMKKLNLKYTSYVDTAGLEIFRTKLSDYLNASRGLKTTFENILVTRGSTMGLYLIVSALFQKGQIAIVGDTNYYYADRTFLNAGMQLTRIKVDDHGIDVDAIEKISRRRKISAVFITPHHHFPTTVTLSAERRMKLLSLAEKAGFVIIEDDYDYDFHYQSAPILPLVSADDRGMVIYIGTLSKTISPAIRTGYVVAPVNLITELSKLRQLVDSQGDPIMELALTDMLEDGTIKRHLKKALKQYRSRRDFVCSALAQKLPDQIEFNIPDGGLSIWAKFHPSIPLPPLAEKLKGKGVILSNGLIYNNTGISLNATRLGFGWMTLQEAEKAIDILASTIRTT